MVQELKTKEDFEKCKADAGGKLIVVDFYADWCGPCRMIAPKIQEMSNEFTDVVFVKVNVDEAADFAQEMGIEAMPTFKMFKNGAEVETIVGASEQKIRESVTKHK